MEFSSFVITPKGHALMAKLMLGSGQCNFTGIKLSSQAYSEAQLPTLNAIENIKQTAPITRKTISNNTSLMVEGAVDNVSLTTGYQIQTIGLYAQGPDEGEILYAVARALTAGYMPPYNGISVSGAYFKFLVTVDSASKVTLTVDPAGYASIGDVVNLTNELADLKGYVGYIEDDVFGVEVDYTNKTFKRIAGAIGKTPGASFDSIPCFGGRRRCILTDNGVVLAYQGEAGYTETGALVAAVTLGKNNSATTYPVGTKVQVMVEQPKCYYKVVPLSVEKITQDNGKGYHMRKARYYVSMSPKTGFKLHPAFKHKGKEDNVIYLSAYEGSIYDKSISRYILDDAVIADFTATTGDQLASIAGAKPASGLVNALTRANTRKLAHNRGAGWEQQTVQTMALTQLLYTIEYGAMNMQTGLGAGVTNKTDDGATNMTEITGATINLGNASGFVTNDNGINVVTYRGEENFYGNIWKWIDGINIENGVGEVYIADNAFADDSKTTPYRNAAISIARVNGYISAFAYNEEFDWLFIPSETIGNSVLPVGDYFYRDAAAVGWQVCRLGGHWNIGDNAGGFFLNMIYTSSFRARITGGRLVYIPALAAA